MQIPNHIAASQFIFLAEHYESNKDFISAANYYRLAVRLLSSSVIDLTEKIDYVNSQRLEQAKNVMGGAS